MSYLDKLPDYYPNVDSGNGMDDPIFMHYPMIKNETNIT
jgi:hypothetical protein